MIEKINQQIANQERVKFWSKTNNLAENKTTECKNLNDRLLRQGVKAEREPNGYASRSLHSISIKLERFSLRGKHKKLQFYVQAINNITSTTSPANDYNQRHASTLGGTFRN